jgi:plastocyanin
MVNPSFMVTGGLSGATMAPEVVVNDQSYISETLTIAKVVSSGPGWIVIHNDNNGAPGPVVGFAPVKDGENLDVKVEVDDSEATETLFAMLHIDAGVVGTYEFPGADVPVQGDAAMVNPSFRATDESEASNGGMQASVSMSGGSFDPQELTVKAGTTVVWTNTASNAHTVTADDGSFDSGNMNANDTFQFTFTTPGTYPYYCAYHGGPGGAGMAGTVIVTP